MRSKWWAQQTVERVSLVFSAYFSTNDSLAGQHNLYLGGSLLCYMISYNSKVGLIQKVTDNVMQVSQIYISLSYVIFIIPEKMWRNVISCSACNERWSFN